MVSENERPIGEARPLDVELMRITADLIYALNYARLIIDQIVDDDSAESKEVVKRVLLPSLAEKIKSSEDRLNKALDRMLAGVKS
jgi:hypothetical protein